MTCPVARKSVMLRQCLTLAEALPQRATVALRSRLRGSASGCPSINPLRLILAFGPGAAQGLCKWQNRRVRVVGIGPNLTSAATTRWRVTQCQPWFPGAFPQSIDCNHRGEGSLTYQRYAAFARHPAHCSC
jgi:hypothetical protein